MNQRAYGTAILLALCMGTLALVGCGYNKQTDPMLSAYRSGDYETASRLGAEQAKKANKDNRVLAHLEHAAVLRAAERYPESVEAFDNAEQAVQVWEGEPEAKLSSETAATFTNATALPYRGYAYDRIMLNVYQALNYMNQGNFDAARVELRRAYERQREAVDKAAKKIEEEQASADNRAKAQQTIDSAEFQGAYQEHYGNLDQYTVYGDYVNPFAEWLQALFYISRSSGPDDNERAVQSFKRVAGMLDNEPYVMQDLAMAEAAARGGRLPATTYVVFETGLAPKREPFRVRLPLFFASLSAPHVKIEFPKLAYNGRFTTGLTAQAGGQSHRTRVICSMDNVVTTEFENLLPEVITKTIISVGLKTAGSVVAQEAARSSGNTWAQVGAVVGMAVFQEVVNVADLRTWRTLPKQFEMARFATPQDRTVTLTGGAAPVSLQLEPGTINVVYVKNVEPGAPMHVSQFVLR